MKGHADYYYTRMIVLNIICKSANAWQPISQDPGNPKYDQVPGSIRISCSYPFTDLFHYTN